MANEQTIKRKRIEEEDANHKTPKLDKNPDIMDLHLNLVTAERIRHQEVKLEANHERSDLTALGKTILLGHEVNNEEARAEFMDMTDLPASRASWVWKEFGREYPEVKKHLLYRMIEFEMKYQRVAYKIKMGRGEQFDTVFG